MEYLPSMFVVVPEVVPLIWIVAPGRDSLVSEADIVPVMVLTWPTEKEVIPIINKGIIPALKNLSSVFLIGQKIFINF